MVITIIWRDTLSGALSKTTPHISVEWNQQNRTLCWTDSKFPEVHTSKCSGKLEHEIFHVSVVVGEFFGLAS